MRILDAIWHPSANKLVIECECGMLFNAPSNRWNLQCPACQKHGNLKVLREKYLKEHSCS